MPLKAICPDFYKFYIIIYNTLYIFVKALPWKNQNADKVGCFYLFFYKLYSKRIENEALNLKKLNETCTLLSKLYQSEDV